MWGFARSAARPEPPPSPERQDHWESWEVASHGTAGDAKDVSYAEGIERCIGHGRRHIEVRNHLSGGAAMLKVES